MKNNSKKKKIIRIIIFSFLILIAGIFVFAKVKRITPLSWGHADVNTPMFSNQAINGYDPVAYHIRQEAVKGNAQFTYEWKKSLWYFSSLENKQLFIDTPEKYVPEYGGYCSYAVSKGFTANPEPTVFALIDEKLYFFADQGVKKEWLSQSQENISFCNKNW